MTHCVTFVSCCCAVQLSFCSDGMSEFFVDRVILNLFLMLLTCLHRLVIVLWFWYWWYLTCRWSSTNIISFEWRPLHYVLFRYMYECAHNFYRRFSVVRQRYCLLFCIFIWYIYSYTDCYYETLAPLQPFKVCIVCCTSVSFNKIIIDNCTDSSIGQALSKGRVRQLVAGALMCLIAMISIFARFVVVVCN